MTWLRGRSAATLAGLVVTRFPVPGRRRWWLRPPPFFVTVFPAGGVPESGEVVQVRRRRGGALEVVRRGVGG